MSEGREEPTAVLDRPARERTTLRTRIRRCRSWVRRRPRLNVVWRCGIALLGTVVLVAGIVMIPYPGPGWTVVLVGLAILATEFVWAKHLLHWVRRHYDRWVAWVSRQSMVIKLLLGLMTCAVVLATLFLLDMLWLVARLTGFGEWTWLQSPIMA